jgi:hypothetical protein
LYVIPCRHFLYDDKASVFIAFSYRNFGAFVATARGSSTSRYVGKFAGNKHSALAFTVDQARFANTGGKFFNDDKLAEYVTLVYRDRRTAH